jgi:uncharacterized MAPEG superfamily protein
MPCAARDGRRREVDAPGAQAEARKVKLRQEAHSGADIMSVELTMLTYSVGLLFVLVFLQALAGIRAQGAVPLANSRDGLPPPSGFHARMKRVVDNHREGLTMFAPLVLVAAVAGVSSETTVLGAQLFFYSRVAHAVLYIFGVPMVRPLAWTVGLVGTVMVFAALLGLA